MEVEKRFSLMSYLLRHNHTFLQIEVFIKLNWLSGKQHYYSPPFSVSLISSSVLWGSWSKQSNLTSHWNFQHVCCQFLYKFHNDMPWKMYLPCYCLEDPFVMKQIPIATRQIDNFWRVRASAENTERPKNFSGMTARIYPRERVCSRQSSSFFFPIVITGALVLLITWSANNKITSSTKEQ